MHLTVSAIIEPVNVSVKLCVQMNVKMAGVRGSVSV